MNAQDLYKSLSKEIGELEARIILRERTGLEWADLIGDSSTTLKQAQLDLVHNDLESRRNGRPLSKIYGRKEFWGLTFEVNENTLDPRADSETLVEAILNHYKRRGSTPTKVLDLGTGTGCLLLSVLNEFPEATGLGIDISDDALTIAKKNSKALNLDSRTCFQHGDWTESINETFDLIVSNPPYIESSVIPTLEKEVKNHDPILALDGGEDGLQAYRNIFSSLSRRLHDDGFAIFEIGFDQSETVTRLSEKYGLFPSTVHADLAGNPRAVEIFKTEKYRHQWG